MENDITWGEVCIAKEAKKGIGFRAYRHNPKLPNGFENPVQNIDHFFLSRRTFPEHSHSGISAVTYLFEWSRNSLINTDSVGNKNLVIGPGDILWTQTSSGIIHDEIPKEDGQVCEGLQIFIDIPAKFKGQDPTSFYSEHKDLPKKHIGLARIKIIAGKFQEARSKIQPDWPTDIIEISFTKDSQIDVIVMPNEVISILNIGAEINVNSLKIEQNSSVSGVNLSKSEQEVSISGTIKSIFYVLKTKLMEIN